MGETVRYEGVIVSKPYRLTMHSSIAAKGSESCFGDDIRCIFNWLSDLLYAQRSLPSDNEGIFLSLGSRIPLNF